MQKFTLALAEAKDLLSTSLNWSLALIRKRTVTRERQSRKAWKRWMGQQQTAVGAGGLLFRFIKRIEEELDLAIRCAGERTAAPRDIVEEDFKVWNGLWQMLVAHADDPWRSDEEEQGQGEQELPELNAEVLKKAARTFKHRTAVGTDAVAPG